MSNKSKDFRPILAEGALNGVLYSATQAARGGAVR